MVKSTPATPHSPKTRHNQPISEVHRTLDAFVFHGPQVRLNVLTRPNYVIWRYPEALFVPGRSDV